VGDYLDKGFNIKFIYKPDKRFIPNIAIGLDDLAGTGYFTREYIVATSTINNLDFTFGLGWGNYVGQKAIKNPLSYLNESFSDRTSERSNYGVGGNLSYNKWFRGESTFLGGLEYFSPNIEGLSFKLEYDPYDYMSFSAKNLASASFDLRSKDSNLNYGISYVAARFLTIDLSYIKGNTLNLNFNYAISFNKDIRKKTKFAPNITNTEPNVTDNKQSFYKDLLFNINNNNSLLLQTANIDNKGVLDISISSSAHRNAIRSSSYAASIATEVADNNYIDLSQIRISHLNAGIALNKIEYIANNFDKNSIKSIELKKLHTGIEEGIFDEYKSDEFQPVVKFPVFFTNTSPSIVSHIGNPERFYFGGINIKNVTEIQFKRNLLLSSQLEYPIYSNIQDTVSGPQSVMEHVRTDLVQYLKADGLTISRMQLDYMWSPKKNVYAKISGGLFESMFGGIGGQLLYRPFNKNFDIGFELFNVKQRAYDQRFNFKDYKTTTGHIDFSYYFGYGITSNISFGRYLAKDDGYTFDLSRTTQSGFKAGLYFTQTNVSEETFGEGSFDKGFYFQVPLDLTSKFYRGDFFSFKLSPLTRDGGAKLTYDKDIRGMIYNSRYNEVGSQWKGFLN
jgi:hypothetical protein